MLKRARSAITGRFVSMWHAIHHPNTTVLEDIPESPPKTEPKAPKKR